MSSWCLYFRRSFSDDSLLWRDARAARHRDVLDRAARAELNTPFLIGPDGRVDARVNRWFVSDEMRYLRPGTRRKYAYALRGWLTFLAACGLSWDAADRTAQHAYKTWRLHDSRNSGRVSPGTYYDDLVALYQFHAWAFTEYGTANPIVRRELRGRRRRDGHHREDIRDRVGRFPRP